MLNLSKNLKETEEKVILTTKVSIFITSIFIDNLVEE